MHDQILQRHCPLQKHDDYDDNDNNDYEYGNDEHLKSSRLFEYDQVWHLFYTAIMAMIMCSICSAAPSFLPIGYESKAVSVHCSLPA